MYDIALSVAACVRSGTRADVAWMIAPTASDEALALTPGGGRLGRLASAAFDGMLADFAARQLSTGRLIDHLVTEFESAQCQIPTGTEVQFLVVPSDQFPPETWPLLLSHSPLAIRVELADDTVMSVEVRQDDSSVGSTSVNIEPGVITMNLAPVTRLVIAGQGPIAEALAAQGVLMNWKVIVEPRPDSVAGISATLSPVDAIVVMGHDVEISSRSLMAALDSNAGYIGALGSDAMQESRADWLAYRDVTDLSRVHGPAGFPIKAATPQEIAVSIVSEAISVLRS
jgi:xanthine dehydrogenase accessory factor